SVHINLLPSCSRAGLHRFGAGDRAQCEKADREAGSSDKKSVPGEQHPRPIYPGHRVLHGLFGSSSKTLSTAAAISSGAPIPRTFFQRPVLSFPTRKIFV